MPTVYVAISKLAPLKDKQVTVPSFYKGHYKDVTRASYALLSEMLKNYLHIAYDAATITKQEDGKPFDNTGKFAFNYSHSGDFIICAVGYQKLGVDIETAKKVDARVHGRLLSDAERTNDIDPLQAWVIKEAYSKYTGRGLAAGYAGLSAKELLATHPHKLFTTVDYTAVLFFDIPNTVIHTVNPL